MTTFILLSTFMGVCFSLFVLISFNCQVLKVQFVTVLFMYNVNSLPVTVAHLLNCCVTGAYVLAVIL